VPDECDPAGENDPSGADELRENELRENDAAARMICGSNLCAQKRWRYERQRESGEQTPPSPGHNHHLGTKCLLGELWETKTILAIDRMHCCDGCHKEPVDYVAVGFIESENLRFG
jgi:hypothetical protein